MIRKFFIIVSLLLISSCYKNAFKPMGYLFSNMPKGGTPGFELGWIHGCQSGLGSQFANGFYMNFYTWSRDPDIASSEPNYERIKNRYKKELKNINWNNEAEVKKNFSDYNTIFWSAHSYCRHSVVGLLQSAGMTPKLPGQERYVPGEDNLSSVWKLTGKGDTRIGNTGLW
jgi:hypothetical protein